MDMTRSVRMGLVGTGDMGALHASTARRIGVEVCVAGGRNPGRGRKLAETLDLEFYEDYDALLADSSIEAVDLCVPNHLHRQYAERAFAAGKHVLCEKPIALTLEDADAMVEGAQRAGIVLMVGHVVRFWPEYRRTYDLYHAGELGDLQWLSLRRLTGVLGATQGSDYWRVNPQQSGGAVLDLQIHDIDYLCWLLGPPTAIQARGVRSASGSFDHVASLLSFESGQQALVEASFLMGSYPFDLGFNILADQGTLAYRYSPQSFALHGLQGSSSEGDQAEASLLLYGDDSATELFRPNRDAFEIALEDEIAAFIDGVRKGELSWKSAEQARLSLSVSLASLQACESGEAVEAPF